MVTKSMRPTREGYSKILDKLSKMLRQKPMTAKAIAAAFGCARPVAYQRVRELRKRGETVYTIPLRESPTGPESTAYGVR